MKNFFYSLITPFWPAFVHLLRLFGLKPFGARQPYPVGYVVAGKKPEEFHRFLLHSGLVEDKLAWIDDGQRESLRRLEGMTHQHHVRIYHDGEVRAHYELAPEHDPWGHLRDKDTHFPKPDFMKLLEGWVGSNSQNRGM